MAKGKALIVGVSEPHAPGWTNADFLPGVDDDVRHMRDFLENDCRFQLVEIMLDSQGTHDAVLGKLADATRWLESAAFSATV